ncbi:MAG: magnesium transporter [Thermoguttaceae bacterium]|jgi:magnesium transporter|nr:magnesium transporter [Thermoguttaceae bacterium]
MKNPLLVPEIRELLAEGNFDELREFCDAGHPGIVAEFLSALPAEEAWEALRHAGLERRAEVFTNLDEELQTEIVEGLPRGEVAQLITEMPHDDRVDLIKRLPEETRDVILPALAQAEREDIRRLIAYREGSAGAVMTSDYATLSPDLTASEAIERLRREAPDRETIYYAYVVDQQRKLLGFVSLKDLIVARANRRISDLMHEEVISATVDDDQERAARRIQKYDLIALPVVDANGVLVGIITHDDAIDIITQEQTEDMEKLMAIAGAHEASAYLRTPAWEHFRNRGYWVVGLAALGIFSGMVIHNFEDALTQLLILALYMPMLADTGGNTGSQAATVVVRALALGEITPRDVLRVLWKEFRIASMMALVLATVAFCKVLFLTTWFSVDTAGFPLTTIGVCIGLALGIQVLSATLIGAMLPIGAARLNLDPAIVASPALTTAVDITGLLIYFTTARVLLGV